MDKKTELRYLEIQRELKGLKSVGYDTISEREYKLKREIRKILEDEE